MLDQRPCSLFLIIQGTLLWQIILGHNQQDQLTHLHSLLWHFKTRWNIAIPISKDSMMMIWLHRVKIWWTVGQ